MRNTWNDNFFDGVHFDEREKRRIKPNVDALRLFRTKPYECIPGMWEKKDAKISGSDE